MAGSARMSAVATMRRSATARPTAPSLGLKISAPIVSASTPWVASARSVPSSGSSRNTPAARAFTSSAEPRASSLAIGSTSRVEVSSRASRASTSATSRRRFASWKRRAFWIAMAAWARNRSIMSCLSLPKRSGSVWASAITASSSSPARTGNPEKLRMPQRSVQPRLMFRSSVAMSSTTSFSRWRATQPTVPWS